ncbi:uncharacterized protein LOC110232434 [Exaiptasia diaphana]|uniref:Uncharacterized protein n=1 Tax=Exaiptasia diaphana TaxID=2652724 RepID=A0A913WS66_EXADI|nr:uncharacterized protein LOC110232434 [Exaiptasia diaphana]
MSNRHSYGHILLVRRQSFIPTYFDPCEFQLAHNRRDCDSDLQETPAVEESSQYDDYDTEETLQTQLTDSQTSLHSLLQFLASYHAIYENQTTRFRSSALANLFSCNVSKMSHENKSKLDCDGYFGCPEEKQISKESATFPRRRRPVCIIPWKKRPSIIKSSKKNKSSTKQPKPKSNQRPDSTDAYYVTKVDCVTSTLERTRVSGIKLRIRPKVPPQTQSTKSHPAMFYSYFVSKGCQYRKACAPKRRSCDGFFGCHDGDDHCKDSKGKRKGKKKTHANN